MSSYPKNNQQGRAGGLVAILVIAIVAVGVWVYLQRTGTADNAAAAIGAGAASVTQNAAAHLQADIAEHDANKAASATTVTNTAVDAAGVIDHGMHAVVDQANANANAEKARTNAAIVADQVSASLHTLKGAAASATTPADHGDTDTE